jgi:hypothetical protein
LLKWAREDDELEDTSYAEELIVSSADLVSELQISQCHVGAVIGNVVGIVILIRIRHKEKYD